MSSVRTQPIWASLVLLTVGFGCADTGCGGCGLEPLEASMPPAEKVYDGVLVEITPRGFDFVEQNYEPVLQSFFPDGLAYPLPPDPGDCGGCNVQRICNQEEPCPISAALDGLQMNRIHPDKIVLEGLLSLAGGLDPYASPGAPIPIRACTACIPANCQLELHIKDKPISAEVRLGVDPLTEALNFDVTLRPITIESGRHDDFEIQGGIGCDTLDLIVDGFLENTINEMLNAQIAGQLEAGLDSATCMECGFYQTGCEQGVGYPAYCDTGDPEEPLDDWCRNPDVGDACVRKPLGFVSRVDLGSLLADFGAQASPFDVHVGVGQRRPPADDPFVPRDGGPLDLRVATGAWAAPSDCVPPAVTFPEMAPPPRIDFMMEADPSTFMVGIGVSDRFLDKYLYEVYRSGSLCLEVGTDTSEMITAPLFATLLPSLDTLVGGANAPMQIAIRPKDRPLAEIGLGTWREVNGERVLDDPLLTLHLPDLAFDFYALVEERYFRLFTLEADVALPLAIELTPENQLIPILGDLRGMITDIQADNSEILAEDPAILEAVIEAILGFAEPMLGELLQPIQLPDMQGFGLVVTKLGGMVPAAEAGTYEHLGLLADLEFTPPVSPKPAFPVDTAAQVREVLPPADRLDPPGVVLAAQGLATAGRDVEWHHRIDGGLWSPFVRGEAITVTSRKLLVPGRHVFEVRARAVGDYRSLDPEAVRLEVLIDPDAPRARLEVDPATGHAEVHATDAVSAPSALRYAFSVDGGPFSGFSPERSMVLPLEAASVSARVRDEAGNERTVTWTGRAPAPGAAPAQGPEVGCAAGAGGSAWGLWLVLLAPALRARRLRRRLRAPCASGS